MTFRINFVQGSGDRWFCDVDRFDPDARGLGLYTGDQGRGLYVEDEPGQTQVLLPAVQFEIPRESEKHAATTAFARALQALGWGPELDRHGHLVDRDEASHS